MNFNHYIVFDFETDGVDPYTCQPTQLAAVAINGRTLDIYDNDIFDSLIRPDDMSKVSDEVLAFTHIDREKLEQAPSKSEVFNNFQVYISRYSRNNTKYGRPIPAGYNIKGYDMTIIDRLCQEFNKADENGKQTIFSSFNQFDLLDDMFRLTENSDELKKYSESGKPDVKLTTIRRWTGLDTSKAHDAKNDVLHTAMLISRFLKWYRRLMVGTNFAGVFSGK